MSWDRPMLHPLGTPCAKCGGKDRPVAGDDRGILVCVSCDLWQRQVGGPRPLSREEFEQGRVPRRRAR